MRPIRGFTQNAANWEEALSRASMAREWINKHHAGRESFLNALKFFLERRPGRD
jgi:hypothetical protein